jgi:hypothetical protein
MDLPVELVAEWHDHRRLSVSSLTWLDQHRDADDPHPICSAIDQLRRNEVAARHW